MGATAWYYSNPEVDTPPNGMRTVEFSITSSDPAVALDKLLRQKSEKLWVNYADLFHFITDPFASLPFQNATEEGITQWYSKWWQVINRGLRGKAIPYPGQASQNGFSGFFKHTVAHSSEAIKNLGYTHLSGVPSWQYVWGLNLHNGFFPENASMHAEAEHFFAAQAEISIPGFQEGVNYVGEIDEKSAVHSWMALLPFALMLYPKTANIHLPHGANGTGEFNQVLTAAAKVYTTDNGIISYPLRPDKNLWHSKAV